MPSYELSLIVKTLQRIIIMALCAAATGVQCLYYCRVMGCYNRQPYHKDTANFMIFSVRLPGQGISTEQFVFGYVVDSHTIKPELAQVLRRSCVTILEKGGIIRNMENLGHKTLPYKMTAHGKRHTTGSYFLVRFDSPTITLPEVKDELKRDMDIVRYSVFSADEHFVIPCLQGPCQFGELPNPDHERRVWKRKTLKKLNLTKHERENLL